MGKETLGTSQWCTWHCAGLLDFDVGPAVVSSPKPGLGVTLVPLWPVLPVGGIEQR